MKCGYPVCSMLLFQMAAFNIQEALIWKEKIESVIDKVSLWSWTMVVDCPFPRVSIFGPG